MTAVQEGDVWQLGVHKLMCGDATNKKHVAQLFAGQNPTLVVTSPPYAKQRDYDRPIPCWDSMMMGALNGHNFADDVQMLVNLGPHHKNNEIVFYWTTWIDLMRKQKWRFYSQYIWDKKLAVAGHFQGRLRPSHEFIFHINMVTINANKWEPCIHAGKLRINSKTGIKGRDGLPRKRAPVPVGLKKVSGSVISHMPVLVHEAVGVPAQMPKGLAAVLIRSWAKKGCLAYDPFAGSGTTIHAAEAEGVLGLGMEVSPNYCAIAIERWNKAHPEQMATRLP